MTAFSFAGQMFATAFAVWISAWQAFVAPSDNVYIRSLFRFALVLSVTWLLIIVTVASDSPKGGL